MAYYQLTPAERMARARQLRAQREARLGYQPSSESLLSNYLLPTERSVGVERVQDAVQPTAQRKESNIFDDILDFFGDANATVLDVGSNLATGAVDVLEGVVDLGAGFVGKIGGYFSDEFERAMEDVIAYDASRNWIEKPLDDMGLSRSWLNQGEVGDFASNVLQGVGGLLPAVILTAATGGGAAVGLGVTMAGAAGGGTEEALNDGANLGKALNYGVVTGAIEGGTEAALGGVPVFGKGFLKGAKEVAETGGKRILKGMLEEGAEEAIATLASPLAKTTYQGTKAHREYFEPEFWGEVATDAAAGALVSGAYGGTVGHIMHQSGKDADIGDSMEAIKEVKKKRRTLQSDSKLTPEEDIRLRGSYEANMQNIQTALQKASPKERTALIKRHRLGNAFTEDGQIRPEFAVKDYTLSTTPTTATNGAVEADSGSQSVSEATPDNRYRSADLIGHDEEIQSDLDRITEALKAKGEQNANAKVDLFRGELSDTARANFTEMMKATDELSDHTQTGINLAIVDSGGRMNGVVLSDGNTVYMDYRVLESGIAPKVLVEEVAHFSEGTQSYGDVVRFIAEDTDLIARVTDELAGDGSGYSFTEDTVKSIADKIVSGEELTKTEIEFKNELNAHMVAETLGSSDFMQKLIKGKPNLAEKLINRIKALSAALTGAEGKEARTQRKRLAKAEKLWMQAVEDAGYKYVNNKLHAAIDEAKEEEAVTRMNAEKVEDAEETKVSFSIDKSFSKQVDDVLSGADTENSHLRLMEKTPELLQDAGLPDLPILMTANHLKSITGKGDRGNQHTLSITTVKNLPQYLADPVMIMDSLTRDDSVVILVEERDQNGNPVVCAVKLDGKGRWENIDISANVLTSAYGKDNFQSFIDRNAENDTVFYWNEKKTRALFNSPGLQLPNEIERLASNTIIRKAKAFVNTSSKKSSESSGKAQFSLPETTRAKDTAQRSRSKVYTRDDAVKIAQAVMQDARIFANETGKYVGKLRNKGEMIDELWARLNRTKPGSEERKRAAAELADSIIGHVVVTMAADDPTMEAYRARVDTLKEYFHKLDLDSIKGDLKSNSKKGSILPFISRWQKKDGGGMTPDQIVGELAERGVVIDAENPADILLEMDRLYTEAVNGIAANSNLYVEQIMSEAEFDAFRKTIATEIENETVNKGSMSNLARAYFDEYARMKYDYERSLADNAADYERAKAANDEKTQKDIEKRRKQLETERKNYEVNLSEIREKARDYKSEMQKKYREQEKSARLIREIVFRAGKLKDLKLGKLHTVNEFNNETFKGTLERLSGIVRGGQLSVDAVREIAADLAGWMGWINDVNVEPIEEKRYDLQNIRTNLEYLGRGTGALSVTELQMLSATIRDITTYVQTYQKVRRNGKLVDASPIAEKYVKLIDESNRAPRGIMRKFFESGFMGKFADPATLMRYADNYEEDGFFLETFYEFREGAAKVAITRMELTQNYNNFMEKHKGYENRLQEIVEVRGQKMPLDVAISLWMTSKRKQAQLGLVKSGMEFRMEPVRDDGKKQKKDKKNAQRVFDFAPLGDHTADYTEAELDQMMKELRSEIEKVMNETDRAYIATVDGIFDMCAEIKTDVDMRRMGYTNVDKNQYYYPIRRANKAENIDTESWMEGLDRVSHLSMNQNTVKGAWSKLNISGVSATLSKHITQVSLYNGIADAVDNFNVLVNLNTVENRGNPVNVQTMAKRTDFGSYALDYLKKLKQDIEQVNRIDIDDNGTMKMLSKLRGAYATSVLGANPKVWVTQLSSLVAASNALDYKNILRGFSLRDKVAKGGEAEVDKYCPLAKQRNLDNVAYEAQSVSERVLNKATHALTKPIGVMDRFTINRLWGACQVQIEENGGAKVGTVENKTAAGKLLEKVILETQQNALATERSSAMRSSNELLRTVTMFSADAMKVIGRVFDAYGEHHMISQKLKNKNLSESERNSLEAQKKAAGKKLARSVSALVVSSIFMALVAAGIKGLFDLFKDDEEADDIALDIAADAFGNMLGGLPIYRDLYGFFVQGYDISHYGYDTVNTLLEAVQGVEKVFDGDYTAQQRAGAIRALLYAGGGILGIPAKNMYKYSVGLIRRFFPDVGYSIDAIFDKKNYKSDLKKAIEKNDPRMIARIAEIMTNENYGMYDKATRTALQKLVESGYTVFPRSVGDTITVGEETYELTKAQRDRFEKVYSISNRAVEDLVKLDQFKNADDEEKAKALKYIYDTYYEIAIDDLTGAESSKKRVLFSEVMDIEKLALIAVHANSLESDKDKSGKIVNGSRKNKVVSYVNTLKLTAAEKYLVMGFLGYKNTNGKSQVQSLINKSSLSRTEKDTLLAYCGY